MAFSFSTESRNGVLIVSITGTFGGASVPKVREAVEKAIAEGSTVLVFDLSRTQFLDSIALGLLMRAHKTLTGRGGNVALAGASASLMHSLEPTSITRVIPLYSSVSEAIDNAASPVTSEERGTYCLIRVRGEFGIGAVKFVRETVDQSIAIGHNRIGFDLCDTSGIGSIGLGLIVNVHKRLAETGGNAFMVNIRDEIRPAVNTAGISQIVRVYPSLDDVDDDMG